MIMAVEPKQPILLGGETYWRIEAALSAKNYSIAPIILPGICIASPRDSRSPRLDRDHTPGSRCLNVVEIVFPAGDYNELVRIIEEELPMYAGTSAPVQITHSESPAPHPHHRASSTQRLNHKLAHGLLRDWKSPHIVLEEPDTTASPYTATSDEQVMAAVQKDEADPLTIAQQITTDMDVLAETVRKYRQATQLLTNVKTLLQHMDESTAFCLLQEEDASTKSSNRFMPIMAFSHALEQEYRNVNYELEQFFSDGPVPYEEMGG